MNVTLSKGGQGERVVRLEAITIPDLWHAGETPAERSRILEVWNLAHDLKRELLEREEEHAALLAVAEDAVVVAVEAEGGSTFRKGTTGHDYLCNLQGSLAALAAVRGGKEGDK